MALHREDIPISCSHPSHEPGVACELWFHGKCCGYRNVEVAYRHDLGAIILYCPSERCHREITRIAVASKIPLQNVIDLVGRYTGGTPTEEDVLPALEAHLIELNRLHAAVPTDERVRQSVERGFEQWRTNVGPQAVDEGFSHLSKTDLFTDLTHEIMRLLNGDAKP